MKQALTFLLVLALAAFLRFYRLGEKPYHHDESIHAWYSQGIVDKGLDSYKHDPAYQPPFQYLSSALALKLLGPTDFAGRFLPALCGALLVAFFFFWRGHLGWEGALAASGLMAVSPTFVFLSRFFRPDIYLAAASLAAVWGTVTFEKNRSPQGLAALLGSALAFGLGLAAHKGTWLFLFIGALFALTVLASRMIHSVHEPPSLPWQKAGERAETLRWYGGLGLAALAAAFSSAVIFSSLLHNPMEIIEGPFKTVGFAVKEHSSSIMKHYHYGFLLGFYEPGLILLAAIGAWKSLRQAPIWLLPLLVFWLLAVLFLPGWLFKFAPPRAVFVLGLFSAILAAPFAVWTLVSDKKGDLVPAFSLFWAIAAFSLYSFSSMRLPWLAGALLAPLLILAACGFSALNSFPAKLALAGFAVATSLWGTLSLSFKGQGANPAEPHNYVQTSTDMTLLRDRLVSASESLYGKRVLKVAVEDTASWPLSWYLHSFDNAQIGFQPPLSLSVEFVKKSEVAISGIDDTRPEFDKAVRREFSDGFRPVRLKIREWCHPISISDLEAWERPIHAGRLFLSREASWTRGNGKSPYGSADLRVWVRKGFSYPFEWPQRPE